MILVGILFLKYIIIIPIIGWWFWWILVGIMVMPCFGWYFSTIHCQRWFWLVLFSFLWFQLTLLSQDILFDIIVILVFGRWVSFRLVILVNIIFPIGFADSEIMMGLRQFFLLRWLRGQRLHMVPFRALTHSNRVSFRISWSPILKIWKRKIVCLFVVYPELSGGKQDKNNNNNDKNDNNNNINIIKKSQ